MIIMSAIIELEKQILALSAAEREQLAATTWESLIGDPGAEGNPNIDPEGIEIAVQRDAAIETGAAQSISHAEFLRRTGGMSK